MEMQVPAAVIDAHHAAVRPDFGAHTEFRFSPQLHAHFDRQTRALWSRWTASPRPCFNPGLLADIRAYYSFVADSGGTIDCGDSSEPIEYVVLASGMPGVFNLGGDLDLFRQKIDRRDRNALSTYGRACIDVLYRNYIGHDLPVTTVSLVQGECLGGGFEAALSSQVIIAERSARFGFPEIMFNLFPGMGAVSFVLRRTNEKVARELTENPTLYGAEEMLKRGIIDMVVEDGEGPDAVREYLRKKEPTMRTLFRMRTRVNQLKREELDEIVAMWVDAALRLNPRDLRLMGHLVARQEKLA